MEQNKSYDPNEPNNGQPYTPDTQTGTQNTQPANPNEQPTVTYTQPTETYTQPAAPNMRPAATYSQPAAPYTQPAAPYTQPAVQNIQTQTSSAQSESHPARRIISVFFSAVEIILGLRLILKLLGANAENSFIQILYGITGFFVELFEGIFSRVTINEASGAIFEPATLIAMVVVALIALAVLKLLTPRTGSRVVKTEYTGPAGQNGQQK